MIKEEKNIDFYTTGRQPSEREFARISEWIIKEKTKKKAGKSNNLQQRNTSHGKGIANSETDTSPHQQ